MTYVRRLAYIEIEASDLQAWERFGRSVLCAEAVEGTVAGTLHLRIDDRCFRIALRPGSRDDVTAIGLEVDDKNAFDALRRLIGGAGREVALADAEQRMARGVAEMMVLADPAGLRVEISYGALSRPQTPFCPPRAHAGFVTGDQGLGHVMLSVPDVQESQRFYEEVLGFRVSDYIETNYNGRDARFVFLRCNGRHHSLALGNLPVGKRLLHFMVQCRDLDDVGRVLDAVPRSGLKQTRSLGRHVNDKMISFYMETPSKVQVEYGFGGLDVPEESWAVSTYDVTSSWGHKHL